MPLVKSLKRFFASSSCGCNARKNKRSNNKRSNSKRSNSNKRVRRSRKNRRRTLKGGYVNPEHSQSRSRSRSHGKTPRKTPIN